jgi:N-ethylmaleimide reductase
VERIAGGFPLTPYDRSTFYGGGEHGYTDYGTWHAGKAVATQREHNVSLQD